MAETDTVNLVNLDNLSRSRSPSHASVRQQNKPKGNRIAIIILLLVVILIMQVVMTIVVAALLFARDTTCVCPVTSRNEADSITHQTALVGNTTENMMMNMLLKNTESNVLKMINGSSENSVQLLHELQAINLEFQSNATKTMENTEDSLLHIINTLSNHKDSSISTSSVVDDILIGVKELLDVHNTSSLYDSITPVSCKDIKEKLPNSPSGYYHVNNRDIYCNMDELCGSGGGWTRLAYLDMTDSTVNCPDELQYLIYNNIRMCRRPSHSSCGCSSPVKFPSNGISYSEICGRVIGYQYGSTDGLDTKYTYAGCSDSYRNDLNSYYVDGVSLTRGSPRQHVWTFISGIGENYEDSSSSCPCDGIEDPQFIKSHFFCESGNPGTWGLKVYTSDPLWDGKGCGGVLEGECCNAPGLPWFHRQYTSTTTDSMDMRICGDQPTSDEGTPISYYEIFVK